MKKSIGLLILFAFGILSGFAQTTESDSSRWEFNTDVNFYLIPHDFFVLPVFKADKNKLHLEARYNYEDLETFSGWVGYNFTGGNQLEYAITPMFGGMIGFSSGIAPGLETTLNYKRFELYTESEYFFDSDTGNNNFFYTWTDLTYSPKDWFWFGISGQRTRVYQTDLDIQRGLLVGASLKKWELNAYVYNLGFGDPFVLLTISASF